MGRAAPAPGGDWPQRVGPLAWELRSEGARWVVAILHDGVDWWPNLDPGPDGPATRAWPDRLAAVARHDAIADPGAPEHDRVGGTGPGCRRA